jgi:hypothetical protein
MFLFLSSMFFFNKIREQEVGTDFVQKRDGGKGR